MMLNKQFDYFQWCGDYLYCFKRSDDACLIQWFDNDNILWECLFVFDERQRNGPELLSEAIDNIIAGNYKNKQLVDINKLR